MIERLREAVSDRYRVEEKLGEGGMATVYLAEDLKHKRKVAIKVLRPELAAVVGADRFLAEIETTANLQHPHILPLFDSGQADGFLYYVMPYVEGESLRDRLDRGGQMAVDEAVRITCDLAEALDHAHRRGVIHRDIKPANILLQDGRPVIADFGIALAVGKIGGARLTDTGLSLGTPFYMSPEQAMGDQPVTAASDIYALGCVLYELLSGGPPYTAGTAQAVLAKIITSGEVSVREARPSVPRNVDAALRRALERLPTDRFPTAGEFRDALRDPDFRYGEDEAPAERRGIGWPGLVAGVAAGLLVGFFGGRALVRARGPEGGAASTRDRPLQLTFTGETSNPAIAPDGDFVSFVDVTCRQGTFGDCSYDLLVKEVGATTTVTVIEDAEFIGSPHWTWDGSQLVVPAVLDERRSGLFLIPRMGGAIRPVAPLGAFDTHPSGDTVFVVPDAGSPRGLVVDLADGTVVDSVPMPVDEPVSDVAWHPEGDRLAIRSLSSLMVVGRDGALLDQQASAGRDFVRWTVAGNAILQFRVGPVREDDLMRIPVDERGRFSGSPEVVRAGIPTLYAGQIDVARTTGRLVLATGDGRMDVWSFDVHEPRATVQRRTGGTTWYGSPTISWDGETSYYLRGDALGDNVYSLNLADGTEQALTAERSPGGSSVRFSSDGSRLAYTRSGDPYRLDVISFPSGRVSTMSIDFRWATPVPFGERKFVITGDGLAIIDSLGAEPRVIEGTGLSMGGPAAVSPDGKRIAYSARTQQGTPVLAMVSTDGGETRTVEELTDTDLPPGLTWTPGESLYVGQWRLGDPYPTLWRWSDDRQQLQQVTEIPVACLPSTIVVDAAADRGVCQNDESRWDIWAFDGLGRR